MCLSAPTSFMKSHYWVNGKSCLLGWIWVGLLRIRLLSIMVEYAVISYFLVNEENTFGRWVFFCFFMFPVVSKVFQFMQWFKRSENVTEYLIKNQYQNRGKIRGSNTKCKNTLNTFNPKYMKLLPYESNLKRFRISYLPPTIVSEFWTN